MRNALALALFATAVLAQSQREPINAVTAVRTWSLSDATRVAIEVSGSFDYKYDRLHNPERVYFDIKGARPQIAGKRIWSTEVDNKLVRRIRVAETNPDVTRVVLDVSGLVEVSTSQLTNPSRLIIELRLSPPTVPAEAPATSTPPVTTPSPIVTAGIPKIEPVRIERPKLEPVADRMPPPVPETPRETVRPAAVKADAPMATAELAKAARRMSLGGSSLTRALGLKLNRIVLDAGHGGHDQGTTGPKGLLEKDLVLDVTLRLGKLIEQGIGAEVIYTRSDDTFIPLEGRTAIANEKKADLFLSIHANSSPYMRVTGVETYYLNFTDSKEALDVASRENAGSQQSIFDLESLTRKITMHEKLDESREFAGGIRHGVHVGRERVGPLPPGVGPLAVGLPVRLGVDREHDHADRQPHERRGIRLPRVCRQHHRVFALGGGE